MKQHKTLFATVLAVALTTFSLVSHAGTSMTVEINEDAKKYTNPDYVPEFEAEDISYEIKVFKGKELTSSTTTWTQIGVPTSFATYSTLGNTTCEVKSKFFPTTTTVETTAHDGISMIIVPAGKSDDGINTALTVTVSTAELDEEIFLSENCMIRAGDLTTNTMIRVANLPWNKATYFELKDGKTVEVTPHLDKKAPTVINTKA